MLVRKNLLLKKTQRKINERKELIEAVQADGKWLAMYDWKDAIIDDIKEAAIESVVGGMGAGALGGAGALDIKLPADQASNPTAAPLALPAPNNPF